MKVLCIGDICSSGGVFALKKILPKIKAEEKIDVTIVNGENSADGNGVTPSSMRDILSCGADVITGGNHTLKRKEIFDFLEDNDRLLRPHNLSNKFLGKGYTIIDLGFTQLFVINLLGRVFLENIHPLYETAENPFLVLDELIEKANDMGIKNIIVDFHAEATSEKKALMFYAKDRISALFGTHTHVLTADCDVFDGCGYITDIGYTGSYNSVLSVKPDISIAKIKDNANIKFENADAPYILSGVIFDIDNKTGRCKNAKTVCYKNIY